MGIHILDNTLSLGKGCNHNTAEVQGVIDFCDTLCNAGICHIDCGRLAGKQGETGYVWHTVEEADHIFSGGCKAKLSLLLNVSDFDEALFAKPCGSGVSAIRLIFEKGQLYETENAICFLKEQGYRIFLCPKNSLSYSDREWIGLMETVKRISPDACYLFEESGITPNRDGDCFRLFSLMEHNLGKNIMLGIHIRNGFSESFRILSEMCADVRERDVIIDTSVLGIGEGKGFPNTELFADNMDIPHDETAMLRVMEMVWPLTGAASTWGYSPLSYISAKTRTDMDYLFFLYSQGLHFDEIRDVAIRMDDEKKQADFDEEYAADFLRSWRNRTSYLVRI